MIAVPRRRAIGFRLSTMVLVLGSLGFWVWGCGGSDETVGPGQSVDELGQKPPLPRPESLNDTAESEIITIIRPLSGSDLRLEISAAKGNWERLRRQCNDDWLGGGCGSWGVFDRPQGAFSDSPEVVYCSVKPFSSLTLNFIVDGISAAPMGRTNWASYGHHCNWTCGDDNCWYNISWYGQDFQALTSTPHLRRDRYWYREDSTLADEHLVTQEHVSTYTHGVEQTECEEFAGSVAIEAGDPYGVVKATLTASYSVTYTQTITSSTEKTTTFTVQTASPGHVNVYEVWALVDKYTITNADGGDFTDPNYKILPCQPVHIRGIETAHLVTEFEDN